MNILVTNNMTEYIGFVKVKTLVEAYKLVGDINCLIYHKSNESKESKVDLLTRLRDRVKSFVYIRNKSSVDTAVQIAVVGMGGKYFDDEFFLESSDELTRLIQSLDEVTAIAELGGVNVLSDFFNRYLKDGSSGFNESYLVVVKEAVSSMLTEYKQKDLELLQLSETATELFANSAKIISKVESESERLKNMVTALEDAKSKARYAVSSRPVSAPNVLFFPTVSYLKDRNILRVKEVGICTYLASFMLGYRLFLERIKFVRPKLIVTCQVGNQFEVMYKRYTWITQQNQNNPEKYKGSVVFTNFPTKDVLSKLLDDTEYDTFIILDRTKSSKSHILNSKGGSVRYCVSGERLLLDNSIKESSCFSIKKIPGSLFTIPVFQDYPKEVDQRERMYLRECVQQYEALYSLRRV